MTPEQLIKTLSETGLLGLLLALSIIANYLLYKEIKKIQEERVSDIKEAVNLSLEPLKAIKQTVDMILSILQNNRQGRR